MHDYTATVTREATCKQTGERLWVCSGCGESYTEEIPLADHVHGYWVLDLDRRVNEEICTVCGQVLASEPYEEPPVEEKTPTVKIKNNPGTTQLPYRYSLMLTAGRTIWAKGRRSPGIWTACCCGLSRPPKRRRASSSPSCARTLP